MLVATWTLEKIGISIDGEPVKEVVYDRKFGPFTGAFEINVGRPDVPDAERIFAVDEIAALSRRLSDAEIKVLHGAFFRKDVWVDNVKGDDAPAILWTRPLMETERYIGWPSAIRTAKGETIAALRDKVAGKIK